MKFERTRVYNIDGAMYAMRMPMMSHAYSDSYFNDENDFIIGEEDMKLAQNLLRGGSEHSKFMRDIYVHTIITAPQMFVAEQDTYKIGTTRNSSSLMHKGASRDFTMDDFTFDGETEEEIEDFFNTIDQINDLRRKYVETKDYKYFRMMRQKMPMGYNYTYSWSANYAQIRNMWLQRVKHPHRLKEWTEDFAEWVDLLPYSDELIKFEEKE